MLENSSLAACFNILELKVCDLRCKRTGGGLPEGKGRYMKSIGGSFSGREKARGRGTSGTGWEDTHTFIIHWGVEEG